MVAGCKSEGEKNGADLQSPDASAAHLCLRNGGGSNSKNGSKWLSCVTLVFLCRFLSFPCSDVEHRKSFSEMTEAQVHPASSVSAPEGFLTQSDGSNGNGVCLCEIKSDLI